MTLDDILKTSLDPLGWLAMADLCEERGEDPAFWRRLGEWGGKLLPVIRESAPKFAREVELEETARCLILCGRKILMLFIGNRSEPLLWHKEIKLSREHIDYLDCTSPSDIQAVFSGRELPEAYMIRRLCDICFVSRKPLVLR